ncbi:MAG: KpsF/GutQ family sugar-phosphate isomerase [Methylococcaceae bacterium]|nr:KpsF/GutQ family sugar-phosphate isomerase [Methylococcaceae bacterium]
MDPSSTLLPARIAMPDPSIHGYRLAGRRVVEIEARAVAALTERIDARFDAACSLLRGCSGRIIVTGMGKSGHIAGKIAATLASTGSPAFFVHPGEASHGDLGMITAADVVLALSNSGETDELLTILPLIKRLGVPLIAMTGNADSTLAIEANVHLDTAIHEEACPLGLAPTSSTTVCLVMGDALAVALLEAKGFSRDDFALSHPGGSLGRRLLLHVRDIMHPTEDVPVVRERTLIRDAVLQMTTHKIVGLAAVLDSTNRVIGIFTDGDLRRLLERGGDIHAIRIGDAMTRPGTRVIAETLAAEALSIMEAKKINALLVVDGDQRLVGALNMHDLLRARIL